MIVELGLILTVVALGLVIYCGVKTRPVIIPVIGLVTSLLGLAALLQDASITGDQWAFTIVFILGSGLAMFSLAQLIEAVR